MSHAEIARLEMLAEVDGLTADVRQWSERESHWEPINRCAGLLRRVLGRVESLRVRLEAAACRCDIRRDWDREEFTSECLGR
ncbi:MAG: hypothetical protein R3B91_06205 [Planctomycetaceae bacterium]